MRISCYGAQYDITIHKSVYGNGQTCLYATVDDEVWGKLTVAIDGVKLGEGEIIAKTYSENGVWVPQLLVSYPDMFVDTGKRVKCGYTEAEIWKYSPPNDEGV